MDDKFYFAKGTLRYKGEWIIVECPHSVVNYYKWWIEKFIGKKTEYESFLGPFPTRAAAEAHITQLKGN